MENLFEWFGSQGFKLINIYCEQSFGPSQDPDLLPLWEMMDAFWVGMAVVGASTDDLGSNEDLDGNPKTLAIEDGSILDTPAGSEPTSSAAPIEDPTKRAAEIRKELLRPGGSA